MSYYKNEKSELHSLSPSVRDKLSNCVLAGVSGREKPMGFDISSWVMRWDFQGDEKINWGRQIVIGYYVSGLGPL